MKSHFALSSTLLRDIVARALAEDIASGDITTKSLFPKSVQAEAVIQVKQEGIISAHFKKRFFLKTRSSVKILNMVLIIGYHDQKIKR